MNTYKKNGAFLFLRLFFVIITWFVLMPAVMADTKVVESFNYEKPQVSDASGGEGWSGSWKSNVELNQVLNLSVVTGESLDAPTGFQPAPCGGRFEGSSMILCRGLAVGQELDLAADQPYYISFLTKRTLKKGAEPTSSSFTLVLHDKLKEIIGFGHGAGGKLFMSGIAETAGNSTVVGFDQAYLWVIKLSAPDSKQMRTACISVYSATRNIPSREPTVWALTSKPFPASSAVIDRIKIAMGKNIVLGLDELRIGTSWQGVVTASISAP